MRGLSHYSHSFYSSVARVVLFAMVLLLVGGTVYMTHALGSADASASGEDAVLIPQDSIRIRIIAQSDSDEDQAIKRAVKDRVSDLIVSWGELPATLPEARAYIEARLPDIRAVTERALEEENASYGASVELGEVPFPEKTFDGTTYPADDYEALRITLGDGAGANWWCVLFPPLCLTAAVAKDDAAEAGAAADRKTASQAEKAQTAEKAQKIEKTSASVAKGGQLSAPEADGGSGKPKAEFFLVVLLKKLFAFLASLF
ncbi:stage II sporulation protein R [Cohnella fermenti]|uniref:Stage II sporulation protein R n=1 Tax=Cohnella fermenti TaxID=2565925 RepID=A0A4V3WGG0_9BACL|nr:stage II sporulation protein R [Cohnella fermenti]THF84079.1 stage II sporulation protein R [Cohnella fermenti]